MKRLMLKAENQSFRLDRETGRLRIPIRGTEGVQMHLPLADWHRSILAVLSWGLGSLTVVPGKVILVVRKEAPKAYEPEVAIALDTNEDSLDGVVASGESARPVTVSLDGVRRIQAIHFRRRRRLARKKAHDRRVARRLLDREGRLGFELTSADFGPFPAPDGLRSSLSGVLSEALAGPMGTLATGIRVTSVAVSEGDLAIVAELR